MASKNSFILHHSYYEAIKHLSDSDFGALHRAMYEYHMTGVMPPLSGEIAMAFRFIKSQFDREQEKYNGIVERNKINGLKGGRPRNPENPVGYLETQNNPEEPKKADNDDDDDKDLKERNIKERKARGSRFTLTELPTEWKTFCNQKRPDLDAEETFQAFMDWWIAQPGAKGVKLDWLATWRTWIRNQRTRPKSGYEAIPPPISGKELTGEEKQKNKEWLQKMGFHTN